MRRALYPLSACAAALVGATVIAACGTDDGDPAPPLAIVGENNETKDGGASPDAAARPVHDAGASADEAGANDGGAAGVDAGSISNAYVTTYTDWTPTVSLPTSLQQRVQILTDPGPNAARFFSTTFNFANVKDGGYMGLQTDAVRPGMPKGKIAIFSIWNSTSAAKGDAASWCVPFGGEGIGQSCRLPFEWVSGRTYQMRVAMIAANQWRASVTDEADGTERTIGTIQTPTPAGALAGGIGNFVEYYGPSFPSCAALSKSVVTFHAPVENGSAAATWLKNTIGSGACASDRTVTGTSSATHRMGQ